MMIDMPVTSHAAFAICLSVGLRLPVCLSSNTRLNQDKILLNFLHFNSLLFDNFPHFKMKLNLKSFPFLIRPTIEPQKQQAFSLFLSFFLPFFLSLFRVFLLPIPHLSVRPHQRCPSLPPITRSPLSTAAPPLVRLSPVRHRRRAVSVDFFAERRPSSLHLHASRAVFLIRVLSFAALLHTLVFTPFALRTVSVPDAL
eukprot:Selendium_serpulae@DN6314_c4_g4_i1.p1